MTDASEYFLDNYGTCDQGELCYWRPGCLKTGWLGRLCPHWKPLGARNEAELRDMLGHNRNPG